MLLDRKEKQEADRDRTKAVIGYDLGSQTAQISYFLPGGDKPETVSQVAGEEDFLIPAVLARRADRDVWLYGREACQAASRGEAEPVTRLLCRAAEGQSVTLGEESFDPVVLLSLFLKRSLSLLTPVLHPDRAHAFVFSVEEVTRPVVDALMRAAALLELKQASFYVIGRAESFFYYNINQPQELWRQEVLLCDLSGACLRTLLFGTNRRTTPVAAIVDEAAFEAVRPLEETGDVAQDQRSARELDGRFLEALQEALRGRQVTCAYLIGAGFQGQWYQESLQLLCRDRRVFLGNNLYSKGACYAARQRLAPKAAAEYVFLGKDMIKSNLGMHVVRRGTEAYLALLDAGINWYDAGRECDFLLEEADSFTLRITPVDGREIREVLVTLTGLPSRPRRTTRIHLCVDMTDVETVRITMEDLGFGEFFPATHRLWEETFSL